MMRLKKLSLLKIGRFHYTGINNNICKLDKPGDILRNDIIHLIDSLKILRQLNIGQLVLDQTFIDQLGQLLIINIAKLLYLLDGLIDRGLNCLLRLHNGILQELVLLSEGSH